MLGLVETSVDTLLDVGHVAEHMAKKLAASFAAAIANTDAKDASTTAFQVCATTNSVVPSLDADASAVFFVCDIATAAVAAFVA